MQPVLDWIIVRYDVLNTKVDYQLWALKPSCGQNARDDESLETRLGWVADDRVGPKYCVDAAFKELAYMRLV